MSADFSPTFTDYSNLKPFRFWCQKIMPAIYDDSLSYYELLSKVVDALNKVIGDIEAVEQNTDSVLQAFNQLQDYVNSYFESADFSEEIEEALDRMAEGGELGELIETLFADYQEEIDDVLQNQNAIIEEQNDNIAEMQNKMEEYTSMIGQQNAIIENQNTAIQVLEGRMDEFSSLPEGSTSSDAELMDIRVAFDGETYSTAGDAVRAQAKNLDDVVKHEKTGYSFIKTTEMSETTNNGVTRSEVNGVLRLTGTATATRRLVCFNDVNSAKITSAVFNRVINAGSYYVSVKSTGKIDSVNSVVCSYSTFANEFVINDGDVVDLIYPAMIGVVSENGTNWGGTDEYTDIEVKFMRLDNPYTAVVGLNPYNVKAIKNSGEYGEGGYAHQGFPDIDYFNGNIVIASRVSASHYTPDDDSEWGGIEIDTISEIGMLKYERTIKASVDMPLLNGELRDCYIHQLARNNMLMCGWTTYNTDMHDSFLAVLSDKYAVLNYKANPVGNFSLTGKPLVTPEKRVIMCGYRNGRVSVFVSDEPYTTFANLQFTEYNVINGVSRAGNEGCLGYFNDKLYMLVRNNVSNNGCILYATDDLEGKTGWTLVKEYDAGIDGFDVIIHSPRLLAKSTGSKLYFAGANYRSSSDRHSVIGYIDTSDEYKIHIYPVANNLNYGGYTGFVKFNDNEYDMAYYKEGSDTHDATTAIQTGVYYKRVNANTLFPDCTLV